VAENAYRFRDTKTPSNLGAKEAEGAWSRSLTTNKTIVEHEEKSKRRVKGGERCREQREGDD